MLSRIVSSNKKFCIVINHIISNERVRVTNLAKELKSKLGLKRSTSITYASRMLSELSDKGVIERLNSEYRLTPKGWYYIYQYLEYLGRLEDLSYETLFERLRREDRTIALLIPALEIIIKIYREICESGRVEEEVEDLEDLYDSFCFYVDYISEHEEEEPHNWKDILDLIIPPIEEIPSTVFLNLLTERLKGEDELTKAAVKDLLKKKAELLERDAVELKRRAEELRCRAQDLREITKSF